MGEGGELTLFFVLLVSFFYKEIVQRHRVHFSSLRHGDAVAMYLARNDTLQNSVSATHFERRSKRENSTAFVYACSGDWVDKLRGRKSLPDILGLRSCDLRKALHLGRVHFPFEAPERGL